MVSRTEVDHTPRRRRSSWVCSRYPTWGPWDKDRPRDAALPYIGRPNKLHRSSTCTTRSYRNKGPAVIAGGDVSTCRRIDTPRTSLAEIQIRRNKGLSETEDTHLGLDNREKDCACEPCSTIKWTLILPGESEQAGLCPACPPDCDPATVGGVWVAARRNRVQNEVKLAGFAEIPVELADTFQKAFPPPAPSISQGLPRNEPKTTTVF